MVNKKGWIKIIEAFMSLIFLLGFLMIIIGNHNASEVNSVGVENSITNILNVVETNSTLRNSVLSAKLPSYSDNTSFPPDISYYLDNNSFLGYSCEMGICSFEDNCPIYSNIAGDVYSSEILVFSNSTYYSPRKVKLSCH